MPPPAAAAEKEKEFIATCSQGLLVHQVFNHETIKRFEIHGCLEVYVPTMKMEA